jgi:hypothetical protein
MKLSSAPPASDITNCFIFLGAHPHSKLVAMLEQKTQNFVDFNQKLFSLFVITKRKLKVSVCEASADLVFMMIKFNLLVISIARRSKNRDEGILSHSNGLSSSAFIPL